MLKIRVLAGVILLLAAVAADAREVWERSWIEVRSEHFVIASALSEQRTVELARELEDFRSAVDALTGAAGIEDPIPTKIFLLPRAERALGFDGKFIGYFNPRMRANYAVMIPESGKSSAETLKHEYTHYLIRNRDRLRYPAWIEEGLSEVFSTLSVDGTVLEYGRLLEGRVDSLIYERWLPFEDVIAARDTGSMSRRVGPMFYAQSWLLVHYLMIGRQESPFSVESAEYVRRLGAREDPLQAFETVFGLTVASLDRELTDYGRRLGYLRLSLKAPFAAPKLAIREIPLDEVAAQVGLLALLRGNLDAAEEFYAAALEQNSDNAAALVGMADLHKFADRYDDAVPLYERALELAPDNPEHWLDYGEYFLDRAVEAASDEERREFTAEARRRFARSYQLDSSNPETLAQNGLTYLFDGEDVAKGLSSLEAAYDLLPSQEEIQLLLAQAYVVAGRVDEARELLEGLLAGSHPTRAEQIEAALAALDDAAAEAPPEAIAR